MIIPNVIEETARGERHMDIFSRLLSDRIIIIGTEINDTVANITVAQLIFLHAQDSKKPINLYINSPGGIISSGLAIYDTMQYLDCDVNTYCIGMAASLGALLLCAGAKGKRFALPHSRMMIHQPHGGVGGTSADIERQAEEIIRLKKTLSSIISHHTNQPLERIVEDSDRDFYLSAEEAKAYGLIDHVVYSKKKDAIHSLKT